MQQISEMEDSHKVEIDQMAEELEKKEQLVAELKDQIE